MANLLDDLGVHRLLMGGNSLKLESLLIDRLTKVSLVLVWFTMKRYMRLSKLDFGCRGRGGELQGALL